MALVVIDAIDMLWLVVPTMLNVWIYIITIKAVGQARYKFSTLRTHVPRREQHHTRAHMCTRVCVCVCVRVCMCVCVCEMLMYRSAMEGALFLFCGLLSSFCRG